MIVGATSQTPISTWYGKPLPVAKVKPAVVHRDWIFVASVNGKQIKGAAILEACLAYFGVSMVDVFRSRKRGKPLLAKRAFCVLARELTSLSYPQIAQMIGCDHSTIVHHKDVGLQLDELSVALIQIKARLI